MLRASEVEIQVEMDTQMSIYESVKMRWIDEQTLEFDGTRFRVTFDSAQYDTKSTAERFLLLKAKEQLEHYIELSRELKIERVFELGVWQGGSTVFFEKLFRPIKMVAIDWSSPQPVLNDYILNRGLQEKIRLFFNVDQADRPRLTEILDREFPGQLLDLVVDDASHKLHQTMASFNVLFPRLRPGGVYVIEDWGWEHWPGTWQTDANPFHGTRSLTNLIFEIVMTSASNSGIVAGISIWDNVVHVRRGSQPLGSDFDISTSYLIRDRTAFAPVFGDYDPRTLEIARSVARMEKDVPMLSRILRAIARRLAPG